MAKITDDTEELLCFFDYPAEHWGHLKTSNPIESTFSSVRLRTRVTKGPGSKAAGLAMAFKLLEAAQERWRAVNGPDLVALVRAGARFDKGGDGRASGRGWGGRRVTTKNRQSTTIDDSSTRPAWQASTPCSWFGLRRRPGRTQRHGPLIIHVP